MEAVRGSTLPHFALVRWDEEAPGVSLRRRVPPGNEAASLPGRSGFNGGQTVQVCSGRMTTSNLLPVNNDAIMATVGREHILP